MRKVGITGTIAAGKTSLSILLKRRGMSVFNSDRYAGLCLYANHPACAKIVETFGDVTMENGDIDRKKLASIVFHDDEKRKQLNAIVHPYVIAGMEKFFASKEDAFAFAEVPLLFEAGMEKYFDEIVIVTCDKDTAVKRMMEDRDYTEEEALARYNSQIDMDDQIARSDYVIENNGSLKDLDHAVNLYMRELRQRVKNNVA